MKRAGRYILYFIILAVIVFFSLGLIFPTEKFQNKISAKGSITHSFAVLSNFAKFKDWIPGFKKMEMVEGLPYFPGSKMKITVVQDGKEYELIQEVTEIVPMKSVSFTIDNSIFHSEVTINLEESGDQTNFVIDHTIRGNNIFWRSVLFWMKNYFEKMQQDSYDKLKKVIEATPAVS